MKLIEEFTERAVVMDVSGNDGFVVVGRLLERIGVRMSATRMAAANCVAVIVQSKDGGMMQRRPEVQQ